MTTKDPQWDVETALNNLPQEMKLTPEPKFQDDIIVNSFNKILSKLKVIQNVDHDTAGVIFLLLMQCGAYLKSVTKRVVKFGNREFTKEEIITAINQLKNNLPQGITLRNITYYYRNEMVEVAKRFDQAGHLYAQFKNAYPTLKINTKPSREFSYYCTDVQYDNPSAPEIVRIFLSNRRNKRSGKKSD